MFFILQMPYPSLAASNMSTVVSNRTKVSYAVTALRKDPAYINFYVNWFRLIVSGVLPMAILVILNVNIYLKIGETRKNRAGQGAQAGAITTAVPAPSTATTATTTTVATCNNNAKRKTLSPYANR
jgi:hypothetical protein